MIKNHTALFDFESSIDELDGYINGFSNKDSKPKKNTP